MNNITIRNIEPADNAALANIVRRSLEEFNAAKPGTVYFDPTTDNLYQVFQQERSAYFVVLINNEAAGGAGIYPTENLPVDTCELVKMYLSSAARGKGIGKILMEKCFEAAKEKGFAKIYLETMPELKLAIPMYEKFGFTYLDGAQGNSGHTGCDVWMIKEL